MKELIKYFIWRIKRDDIALQAGALAYTSVLALVPAVTIVLSIFAMVPAFTPVKQEMMAFATNNFLPVFTDAIGDSITTFVNHAASMTITGSLMLFLVALMLIRSIDQALNRIWRGGKRSFTMTFAIYWTMLTVGPLSLGIVVWVSTKLIASRFIEDMQLDSAVRVLLSILPFLVEAGMIFVIYTVIPVCKVKARDAAMGAFLVTAIFEVLKRLFSTFILNFSSYEAIYGALAALPVLMIWIYLNWWLILIGAEFTSVLGIARGDGTEQVPKLIRSLVSATEANRMHGRILYSSEDLKNKEAKRSIKVQISPNRQRLDK